MLKLKSWPHIAYQIIYLLFINYKLLSFTNFAGYNFPLKQFEIYMFIQNILS